MKENNETTELVFILDRSGSMAGLEQDTIGGFNAMIEKQKEQSGDCYVSTILFDHESNILHDRIKLQDVETMTENDYVVRGSTALMDAIGKAIVHIQNIHKYARNEDVPKNTMFVITTDGMENASKQYSSDEVKEMIEHQKQTYGWEFLFIGANIDAINSAKRFGIDDERAVNYHADHLGTKILYDTVSDTISCFRSNQAITKEWGRNIEKDFRNRKK